MCDTTKSLRFVRSRRRDFRSARQREQELGRLPGLGQWLRAAVHHHSTVTACVRFGRPAPQHRGARTRGRDPFVRSRSLGVGHFQERLAAEADYRLSLIHI